MWIGNSKSKSSVCTITNRSTNHHISFIGWCRYVAERFLRISCKNLRIVFYTCTTHISKFHMRLAAHYAIDKADKYHAIWERRRSGEYSFSTSNVTCDVNRTTHINIIVPVNSHRCLIENWITERFIKYQCGSVLYTIFPYINIRIRSGIASCTGTHVSHGYHVSIIIGGNSTYDAIRWYTGHIHLHLIKQLAVISVKHRHIDEIIAITKYEIIIYYSHSTIGTHFKTMRIFFQSLETKEPGHITHAIFHKLRSFVHCFVYRFLHTILCSDSNGRHHTQIEDFCHGIVSIRFNSRPWSNGDKCILQLSVDTWRGLIDNNLSFFTLFNRISHYNLSTYIG